MSRAHNVFNQSNGDVTMEFYRDLWKHGRMGEIAVDLFRAVKNSKRAKIYSKDWVKSAYDRKNDSLSKLTLKLQKWSKDFDITWGWKEDWRTRGFKWVLYVDLPGVGQISYHQRERGIGPDYAGEWDRGSSVVTVCRLCTKVLAGDYVKAEIGAHYNALAELWGRA